MFIAENLRLSRIFTYTWKVDLIMIATSTIAFLVNSFLIRHHFEIPVVVPGLLGTAIAFFIGFNNNQAYDRWWEARKIWGMLVNDSRSFTRSIINYAGLQSNADSQQSDLQRRIIHRHIAFLYALKGALRNTDDQAYKNYISAQDFEEVKKHKNVPNAIINLQARELNLLSAKEIINGFEFLQLDNMLVRFTDSMGMAERIRNTVFPTTYNFFTKIFIWLFVVFVALVLSRYMGVWSIFVSWIIGFVFVTTQLNGMSLLNPFDSNSASVPLNQITRTIEINLLEMLGEEKIPEPVKAVNNEYIL